MIENPNNRATPYEQALGDNRKDKLRKTQKEDRAIHTL